MPVEIIGHVHYNRSSMLSPVLPSVFDLDGIVESAKIQERAGFDRVLIANAAIMPDPHVIGTHVAANTSTLKLMLAHRPGFISPTVAARILSTIDRVSNGRAGVHIIAGPKDEELQADGDFVAKPDRYRRSFEYVQIMRQLWTSDEAIDHEGEFYRFKRAYAEVKPVQPGGVPIFWGGASDAAIELGAQCADIYALSGDSLANTRELVLRMGAAAARHSRTIRFVSTFLVIVADTEEAAWKKADDVLAGFQDLQARKAAGWGTVKGQSNFGARVENLHRQVVTAAAGVRQDKCLWMGMTQATQGKQGNQTTLVGTPEQLADALMDYYDMGVTGFLMRGYHPFEDAAEYGNGLIQAVRDAAAKRDAAGPSSLRRA